MFSIFEKAGEEKQKETGAVKEEPKKQVVPFQYVRPEEEDLLNCPEIDEIDRKIKELEEKGGDELLVN